MKLLIVEDEADLLDALQRSLTETGYAVDCAGDAEEALYRVQNWTYDAILLDVMLPSLSGWEILNRIRAHTKTPVLMVTSRGTLDDRVRGLNLGADDYIVKPYALVEIHARLRAVIRRTKGEACDIISFGRIQLDLGKQLLSLDGRPVDLTYSEFAVVEYLAFHRENVVSRTELYEHLFPEAGESFSNLIDVHVCNIRKKVARDFVQTRRGSGFYLMELPPE
jgi:two-component system OmpR family response regulator